MNASQAEQLLRNTIRLKRVNALTGVSTGIKLDGQEYALVGSDLESLQQAFEKWFPGKKFEPKLCLRVVLLQAKHLKGGKL